MGSLLRLLLGAALLCLAWILLSATTAKAAEGPTVLEGVAPVVGELHATTASTLDVGVKGVKAVKAVAVTVPALERLVAQLADDVVTVVDAVPVVGRSPIVAVPLPALPVLPAVPVRPTPPVKTPVVVVVDGEPSPVPAVQGPAKPVARQSTSSSIGAAAVRALSVLDRAVLDSAAPLVGAPLASASDGLPSGPSAPEPTHLPYPSPQSAPMPPTHSVPNPGGGASAADFAALGPALVVPSLTGSGPGSSDWRVPRGLTAQPGARPD